MNQKAFSLSAGIIFLLIALLHLLRVAFGWDAILEGWTVPMWVSWVAILIAAYLAYQGFRLGKKSG